MNERIRSVLSHPLALPLLHTLHGKNPGSMNYLKRTSNFFNDDSDELESTDFDKVFEEVVDVANRPYYKYWVAFDEGAR
jgi:hypothetical protein